MGLGKLLQNRGTQYVATDTVTGASETFTIIDNIAPDWGGRNYRGGMSIPGAWRAALLRSDLIGQVPWAAFRVYGGRPVERIEPTPLLLEQPNPPDNRMTTFSSWALDLIWEGNAVGLVASRNAQGWPTSAIAVPAEQVGVRRITAPGMSTLPVGEIEYSIGTMRNLSSYDVIHIKGPCEPGALRGMGVLEAHMSSLNLSRNLSKQAGAIADHGVPTGILESSNPDLTKDEAREMKSGWLDSQRSRTIAVLNASTSFKPLAWNPEEMQLIEARKFSLHELALIFGVPLSFLGVETGSKTYTNAEAEGLNLLKYYLGGDIARFEQTLSQYMPRGTTAKANLDAVLRSDTLTRYQAHKIALGDKPFLTVDEVRDIEDRAPMPFDEATDTPGEQADPGLPPLPDMPSTPPGGDTDE